MNGLFGKLLGVLLFLAVAGIGVAQLLNPDWFIARSSVRKGGEVLQVWNRLSFRILGGILIGGSLYLLYDFIRDAA
jgi:hypothetical protein